MVSEKLTEHSVNVMALARMEAERACKPSVDVEHILLGLVGSSDGVAAHVLHNSGLRAEDVREHLTKQSTEERMGQREVFSFTIKAGKILNTALQFAIKSEQELIDTEHLLQAVLEEKNWKTIDVLSKFSVDIDRLRADLEQEVSRRAGLVPEEETAGAPKKRGRAVSPTAEYAWPSVTPLFAHFNDSAIQVAMRAQEECRRLGHNYVGTEQLLLGVVPDSGVAGKQFRDLNLSLVQMREEVEKQIGRGSGFVAVEIPFTPRAKMILTSAIEHAKADGLDKIGAEYILLSLLDQKEGVSAGVLEKLAVDVQKLRCDVLNDMKAQSAEKE